MSKLLPVLLLSLVLLSSCSAKPETESIEPTELPVFEVTTPEPTPTVPLWSEEEVDVLAKMVWGEARGVPSDTEKAACVWCALNRVDHGYGSITTVVTAPYQFIGYDADNPIDDEIKALCEDVLTRWYAEKMGKPIRGGFYLLTISGSAEMANTIILEMPTKAEKHGIGRSLPLMKPE